MITISLNSVDITNSVDWRSFKLEFKLANQVDIASMDLFFDNSTKTVRPELYDVLEVEQDSVKIFGGVITKINESRKTNIALTLNIQACDYGYILSRKLVSKSYESQTVRQIIEDINTNFLDSEFTTVNVQSDFEVDKIVFNQVSASECLEDLANALNYHWYVDANKDIHFIARFGESAPFAISETNGNYFVNSFKREIDSSQIVNRVKVRGGEYNGELYTDSITVKGNDTKSFVLPYRFADLSVSLNATPQTLGIDNISDFTTSDVLFNYWEKNIQWETALSDADVIEFSGYPKVPILAVAEDAESIVRYGVNEKIIRDNNIEDLQLARKRAEAELLSFAQELIDVSFSTNIPGLMVGQTVEVSDTFSDYDDNLLVHSISVSLKTPQEALYKVNLVSSKQWDLVSILQKLLKPARLKENDTEVAEVIKVNQGEVQLIEVITKILPTQDIAEVTITETILDSTTPPVFVYGLYTPTGIEDANRGAFFDRGCVYSDTGAEIKAEDFNYISETLNFLYGDGSDGDVTINSDTTLARDMYYSNLTVDNGFVLSPNGYRIFVKGTLTNNGTIRRNGVDGGDGVNGAGTTGGGTGGTAGTALTAGTLPGVPAGKAGGAGGNGGGRGVSGSVSASGTAGENVSYAFNDRALDGKKGGDGGYSHTPIDRPGGASGSAGSAGTQTDIDQPRNIYTLKSLFYTTPTVNEMASTNSGTGGSSGGGGGAGFDDPNGFGVGGKGGGAGGSASSGGIIQIFARTIENNGIIEALGGNGGAGGNGADGVWSTFGTGGMGSAGGGGGGGGGSGGNGGAILILCNVINGSEDISVLGGNGGTGGAGGLGYLEEQLSPNRDGNVGTDGNDGLPGTIFILNS